MPLGVCGECVHVCTQVCLNTCVWRDAGSSGFVFLFPSQEMPVVCTVGQFSFHFNRGKKGP